MTCLEKKFRREEIDQECIFRFCGSFWGYCFLQTKNNIRNISKIIYKETWGQVCCKGVSSPSRAVSPAGAVSALQQFSWVTFYGNLYDLSAMQCQWLIFYRNQFQFKYGSFW